MIIAFGIDIANGMFIEFATAVLAIICDAVKVEDIELGTIKPTSILIEVEVL